VPGIDPVEWVCLRARQCPPIVVPSAPACQRLGPWLRQVARAGLSCWAFGRQTARGSFQRRLQWLVKNVTGSHTAQAGVRPPLARCAS